jgi:hypothetical protein
MTKNKSWDAKLKAKSAATETPEEDSPVITEALLKELCPPEFASEFKKAKTQGQRVDFYYAADAHRKEINRNAKAMEEFLAKLGKWFMQELPDNDATGVAGKTARLQIKKDVVARVVDWPKFYAYIKKNNAFELLNRAVNGKSVKERWDAKKQVPGVDKFDIKKISLTKVK